MEIKVVSYNIQHGFTANLDYALIGADLAAEGADLVGLQELDLFTGRNGNRDSLREIAEAAGYVHYAYAKAIDFMGGAYGTGILSKYPIRSFSVLPLESYGKEQRVVSRATVEIGGREILFLNTHFSLGEREMRRIQFETLADLVKDQAYYIITGDFNTEDFSEFECIEGVNLLNREDRKLLSCEGQAIDNILFPASFQLLASFIRNEAKHSDHDLIGGIFHI